MLFIDLLQRFFGCAVQLELHDIDEFVRLENQINATGTCVVFRLHVETYKLEDDKEYILIVQFQVTNQFIGSIGEEALQTAEESITVSRFYLVDKLPDLKRSSHCIGIGIER